MNIRNTIAVLMLAFTVNTYAGASDWYDLELTNGLLLIDVEIAGRPAKALLDTGAQSIAVDVDFLEANEISFRRGKKIIMSGVFGEVETRTIKNFDISLFGADFPIKSALPLQGNASFQLIIGLPFFKNFIFQIDYPNKRMKIIDRKSLDMRSLANVSLKHGFEKRSLVVKARLSEDESINLLLDIGNSGAIALERQYAEKRGWIEKYSTGKQTMTGVVESVGMEILSLPNFEFGPYNLENVLVSVPEENMPTNIRQDKGRPKTGTLVSKGVEVEGILGYDVLKHFVITLDAKSARMHLYAPE